MKIRNKTIVGFLAVALIITMASTFMNVNSIFDNLITGAAVNTTTGTATLTVTSQTEITLQVSSIAFGSGYVNTTTGGCDSCYMATNVGPVTGNETCCSEFTNVTAGFLIENTGNENVSLNFTCSGSCTAADFINGTGGGFLFALTNSSNGATDGSASNNSGDSTPDSSGSCSSGAGGWNYSKGSDNLYTGWTALAASNYSLCGEADNSQYFFGTEATADAVIMDIALIIPDDALTASEKTATFTFEANSAG